VYKCRAKCGILQYTQAVVGTPCRLSNAKIEFRQTWWLAREWTSGNYQWKVEHWRDLVFGSSKNICAPKPLAHLDPLLRFLSSIYQVYTRYIPFWGIYLLYTHYNILGIPNWILYFSFLQFRASTLASAGEGTPDLAGQQFPEIAYQQL
jgi:hypothetical protein